MFDMVLIMRLDGAADLHQRDLKQFLNSQPACCNLKTSCDHLYWKKCSHIPASQAIHKNNLSIQSRQTS